MKNKLSKHTEGPTVQIKVNCNCGDCKYKLSEKYVCQDDWGYDHYCNHPEVGEKTYIGETGTQTPDFCPFKVVALAESVKGFTKEYSEETKVKELVEAVEKLQEWQEKYPAGKIYPWDMGKRIESELSEIVEMQKQALKNFEE